MAHPLYAEVADADQRADHTGFYDWLRFSDDISIEVDGAFLSTDTTINYINASGSLIEGRYLRIGYEYLQIVSFTTTSVTVVRGQLGSTAADIATGMPAYMQNGEKLKIVNEASRSLESYHGQPRETDGSLFGASEFAEVAQDLALHYFDLRGSRKIAKNIAAITGGEYRDKNIEVDSPLETLIPSWLVSFVDEVLAALGIDTGDIVRH